MSRVFVGMSGGVDSSVAAALLVEQGHEVTGVYMKNWSEDLPGMHCPWAEDVADAKRVAVGLGIDFKVFDFQKEYKRRVVDYMIAEYQAGRTPNPDVMCNQEVKFKLFLEACLEQGAEMIATGHYARVAHGDATEYLTATTPTKISRTASAHRGAHSDISLESAELATLKQSSTRKEASELTPRACADCSANLLVSVSPAVESSSPPSLTGVVKRARIECVSAERSLEISSGDSSEECTPEENGGAVDGRTSAKLLRAKDTDKDQTYFLYRVTGEALAKTIFPLGDYTKAEVREMAKDRGLWTADKKESMGICFVGQVGIREFLSQYVETEPGEIIDKQAGEVVGKHDGAIFYTLGQRHGLNVGGGLPYYVVGKDMEKNQVFVSRSLDDENLWCTDITLMDEHWVNQPPADGAKIQVRLRHRGALVDAIYSAGTLQLASPERAISPGQSAVVYDGEVCLGGGIIAL